MLPPIVEGTHKVRQKRYFDAAKVGIAGPETHLPPSGAHCEICDKEETRGLYRVPLKDGSAIDVGPDCLEGLRGIDASNIDELRALVDPQFRVQQQLNRLRPAGI